MITFVTPAIAQQPIQEESIPAEENPSINSESQAPPAPEKNSGEMSQHDAKKVGYGLGSVVASAVYSPLKVTYAGLGLITGGLGYVLSGGRKDVADKIIYPAVRGNYVITPTHLKGQKPVIFVASPPQPGRQPDQTLAEPPKPESTN